MQALDLHNLNSPVLEKFRVSECINFERNVENVDLKNIPITSVFSLGKLGLIRVFCV